MTVVDFSRTLDKAIVHRVAIAEVFLTSAVEENGEYLIGVQVPRHHGFYSDLLHPYGGYDPMFFMEACRQTLYVLAHQFAGVPLDRFFILRSIGFELLDPSLIVAREAPTNAVLRTRVERWFRDREGNATGMKITHQVMIEGRAALNCMVSFSWLDPQQMVQTRGEGRAQLGLPPGPVACPVPERIQPGLVNRRVPLNVVISALHENGVPGHRSMVVADTAHPSLFDHPLDHLPGMLEVEACRQTAVAGLLSTGHPARGWRLDRMHATFRRFAEFDLPVHCHVRPTEGDGVSDEDSRANRTASITQAEQPVADVELGLTRAPAVMRDGVPQPPPELIRSR